MSGPLAGRLAPFVVLAVCGAGWGLSQPLGKIAMSTGHGAFGVMVWQLAVGAALLGAFTALRGRPLPAGPGDLRLYLVIALIGSVLPGAASLQAVRLLPSGVVSILISMVPIFALPIALAWRLERFAAMRLLGVLLGAAAVVLIGAPESSLPDRAMAAFLPVAMIAPAFYALEGNVVARWGTRGLDPVQVLFGATLLGLPLAAVMAIGLGQWISPLRSWGAAEWAMIGAAAVNTAAYTGYVWLIGRAGAVFAAQVSYLVTLFGVGWAIVLLGERYSFWVWGAMILMLLGLALVQPRPAAPRTVRCPESS